MACLDDNALLRFVESTLPPDEREQAAAHLDECTECRDLLAHVSSLAEGTAAREDARGRYVMLSPLGAGGMGVVYAAFDRQLDRKVALKFLSSDAGEDPDRARARLHLEAQALARLAHPNVITVHDVGVLDGEVFVAMELVEGTTLLAWLRSPRTLPEIVSVLLQAGEGLAAAHAAGLVHCDFKPENVLVGNDGRVRVTDFGLARAEARTDDDAESAGAQPSPANLTRTGVVAGTPAYMAPEQRATGRTNASSDIYSYCLTLREAATGARPPAFERPSRRAPPWLDRIIQRGTRQRPEDRWPSMREALKALSRGPWLTLTRVGAAVALLVFLATAGGLAIGSSRTPALCAADATAFDGIWDDGQRAAVRASFVAADPDEGAFAADRVDAVLSRLRADWIAMRAEACGATRLRHEQSEAVLDLRSGCLDQVRMQASALVRVFRGADAAMVERAPLAVANLPPVNACTNVRALQAIEPPPTDPARRALVDAGERDLATARALLDAYKAEEALAVADRALAASRPADYLPLEAKLRAARALALRAHGDRPSQEVTRALHEAAAKAIEARDDASAASSWMSLEKVDENFADRWAAWNAYAEAAIRRLGGDDALEGERLVLLAQYDEYQTGDFDGAREAFERSRPLLLRAHGPDFPRLGSIDDGLGTIALFEQRFDEAARFLRQGRMHRARTVGTENMLTLVSMINEEDLLVAEGKYDEAAEELREIEAVVSRRHPGTDMDASLEYIGGDLLFRRGDWAAALRRHLRAVDALQARLQPDDAVLARPLTGEGRDLVALGRPAEAITPLERAVALRGPAYHAPDKSDSLFALARALDGAHRGPERARALAEQARAVLAPYGETYGGNYAKDLQSVDEWLARHPRKR